MEASGGYEREWAKALRGAKIEVRIVDPKRVRELRPSAGRLAKNDTIDAEMIAWFAETFGEAPGQAYDAERDKLAQIVNARLGCSTYRPRCKTGVSMPGRKLCKNAGADVEEHRREIAKLEAVIAAMIEATPNFAERAEIIESVPGLARTTSATLIAKMPELGRSMARSAQPCWELHPTMTTAVADAANATSRADAGRSAMPSTWLVWAPRPGTIPCSRPSTIA
jgi:transposase